MPSPSPSRAGGARVTRDQVIRAAAEVCDRDGYDRLTLASVAAELDRHVTSLYTHIESLDDLRGAVALLAVTELSDRVWTAALAKAGEEVLIAIGSAYREYLMQHPGRGQALLVHRAGADAEYAAAGARLSQPVKATLHSLGLDDVQVIQAYRAFSALIRGFSYGDHQHLYGDRAEADGAFAEMMDLMLVAIRTGTWPHPAVSDAEITQPTATTSTSSSPKIG